MHLGNLIERLQSERDAGIALESLADVTLLAEIASMAATYGETPAAYMALAASRFANLAGDADWLDVVGAAERNPDPARAILVCMLRWSLRRDAEEQARLAQPALCSLGVAR